VTARHVAPFALAGLLALTAGCTPKPSDLPVPVTLACNELHEILRVMPFEHVERTQGTVSRPGAAEPSPGCRITAKGSRSHLSVLERTSQHSPDGRLKELLPSRGWREDARFATERPRGNTFAYDRGGVMCDFTVRWGGTEGGPEVDTDKDPDALAPDRYELSVGCALEAS
jgi:hypothetical protein